MMIEDYEPNHLINQDCKNLNSMFIKSPIHHVTIVDECQTDNNYIHIKQELPAVCEGADNIIEPKEEQQSDELEPENLQQSYLVEEDTPAYHSESDSEDDPLMEFRTEVVEEELVSEKKQKASETRKKMQRQRAKATSSQLNHLVNYMKLHQECASGRGNGLQGKVELEKRWRKLAATLNALGGPIKSVDKWKQTWRDVRNSLKKKAIRNKRGGTGNGPAQLQVFTARDEAVISVIGPVAVYGNGAVPSRNPMEVASTTTQQTVGPTVRTPAAPKHRSPCPALAAAPDSRHGPAVPLLPQAVPRPRMRRRHCLTSESVPEIFGLETLKLEKERLELQKKQILLDEKKLNLKKKHLHIEELKVKALERIATALETHNVKE